MELYHKWLYDGSLDVHSEDLLYPDESSHEQEQYPNCYISECPGENELLELSDAVRSSLEKKKIMGDREEEAMAVLGSLLKEECERCQGLDFETIKNARLDKLLADMVDPENAPAQAPPKTLANIKVAERLQRRWRGRFRQRYFDVDQMRLQALTKAGRLKDVVFVPQAENGCRLWHARVLAAPSEVNGTFRFEPGHWWLNSACAHRDGIVTSQVETLSEEPYGTATLSLTTGREELCWAENTVRYIRQGVKSEMLVPLMSQVGSQIKVLRGHCLKSPLAPRAGIRYDGLYVLRQYGRRTTQRTGLEHLTLTLERLDQQRPMSEVLKIPRPSQMDDWHLFEKREGELIRRNYGDMAFLDWKVVKAEQKMDREQLMQSMRLAHELNLARCTRKSKESQVAAESHFAEAV